MHKWKVSISEHVPGKTRNVPGVMQSVTIEWSSMTQEKIECKHNIGGKIKSKELGKENDIKEISFKIVIKQHGFQLESWVGALLEGRDSETRKVVLRGFTLGGGD